MTSIPARPELRADSRYNRDNAYITAHYSLVSATSSRVIVKTPAEGCLKYATLVEADRLAWTLQQVPGVQTTVSLADAVRQITAGTYEGSPKWLTIARNQDVLNYGAQQASVNNPDLFNTDCSVMPVIAYLVRPSSAETLDRVVSAADSIRPRTHDEERRFMLAAAVPASRRRRTSWCEQAWMQMLLLVYAAVDRRCASSRSAAGARAVVAVVPLVAHFDPVRGADGVAGHRRQGRHAAGGRARRRHRRRLRAVPAFGAARAAARRPVAGQSLRHALQFTGKVVVLVGVTLAAGVITWALVADQVPGRHGHPARPSCSCGTWSARWC